VSDTSDDVRRAAVTALAFLLFKNPTQVPRIVQLLSESYNPHVRCGATLALGIACAGTGLQDAIDILQPMTKDGTDFVRQGAYVALGMILVQQSEASSSALASTRAAYHKVISNKHEDPMARFGAVLGQGLIDAGGRNVTISLQSRAGSRNTSAIVGMVLFCQFWYWYPLAHCASLAFEPTGIIGLDENLKVCFLLKWLSLAWCYSTCSLISLPYRHRCLSSCQTPGQVCLRILKRPSRRRKRQLLK
jgi:26S proteasome regulatory subunit N2